MSRFFASTAKGLVEVLESELHSLGIERTERAMGGVFFDGNWEDCYRVNLKSRIASRILKPVDTFIAYQGDDLYFNAIKYDFTKHFDVNQTFKIEASVRDSKIQDQRFVAMKIKDAIADQFREKFDGQRPDVENFNPDVRIYVRGVKNKFEIAIDTSGESLFMRGYRKESGDAPMKENLAASLLALAKWDKKTPVVDFMCGSGTILIEAAMAAMNLAPGSFRREFAFQRLKSYDESVWERLVQEAMNEEKQDLDFHFYGYDVDRKAIAIAKQNAMRAGVDHVIEFKSESVATVQAPCEKGLIVVNPPYGTRIGDEDNLRDVYRDMGFTLKHRFPGWTAWVLSGNKDLIADMKLKASQRRPVYNSNLECRFLRYDMF